MVCARLDSGTMSESTDRFTLMKGRYLSEIRRMEDVIVNLRTKLKLLDEIEADSQKLLALGEGDGSLKGKKLIKAALATVQIIGNNGGAFVTPGEAAIGRVTSVSSSGFSMITRAGQTLTVTEQASTLYRQGSGSASKSAVTTGARVLVIGSRTGSTMLATAVIVLSPGG